MVFPAIVNGSVRLASGQANPTFDGVSGQLQALGGLQLAEFSVSSIFPLHPYRWMRPGSWADGWRYVETIQAVRQRRIPFRAIYLDDSGREIFNLPVSAESFEYGLDESRDISYTIEFREYRFAKTPAVASLTAQAVGEDETGLSWDVRPVQTDAQAAAQAGEGYTRLYTPAEAVMMAKVMYCEARGVRSRTEIACVGWTICNRVDAGYGALAKVITAPNQFAYRAGAPTVSDYGYDLAALAADVLDRWSRERAGQTDVGRVLPRDYLWYAGDGRHNYFRNRYRNGTRWNYALPSPYAD